MMSHQLKLFLFFLLITFSLSKENTEIDANGKSAFESLLKMTSNLRKSNNNNDYPNDMCLKRLNPSTPNSFYFFPNFKAKLYKNGDSNTFTGYCFKQNKITLKSLNFNKTLLEIESSDPTGYFCADVYVVHTSRINHFVTIMTQGTHKIVIKNLNEDDMDEIRLNSIKLVSFCDGIINTLKSLFITLKMFVGGLGWNPEAILPIFRPHIPEYMLKSNLEALKFYMNYEPQPRKDIITEIDENEIHSGDFLAISRIDGIDPMIMIGTGGHIGHSAVCSWIDGKLYVLESQDGPYWPKRGIQRTLFKDWIKQAHDSEFNVALLPMREEYRKKFNNTKALEWFMNGIEGQPYGYPIFLFGWIDTVDSNMPWAITHEHLEFLFTVLEKIYPDLADLMLGQGMNVRLGTNNLTLSQTVAEAARRNLTFEQLVAIPEKDGAKYKDGQEKYTCAVFVANFWKNGGLFDGFEIQGQEFTPKDIYQLDIYEKDYKDKRPEGCKLADPDLPYCQLIGNFTVDLPGYSSIQMYDHMNENCPSLAPDYVRPDGC
jgi:hypothetical protein